jgi:hypothetical protein
MRIKGVKYAPMPPGMHNNSKKTGGFAHFLACKSPKTPFFAQKYLTNILPRRFLRKTLILNLSLLKGTHARDFHSLFLNFFLQLSVTNKYKTQYSQHFRKYSSNSPRYSKFSITRRFRRKRKAWLSVVAGNTELNLALSSQLCVFGLF